MKVAAAIVEILIFHDAIMHEPIVTRTEHPNWWTGHGGM